MGAGNFSLHHGVQNGSKAHPAGYPMETMGSYPGVKRLGRQADHSPPSSAAVKNVWRYASSPPIRLPGVVLSLKKAQGQIYLSSTKIIPLKY